MKLLAGTSGYAFKEWKGSFYPKDLHADAMLGHYATRFPTVEINNTFYRLPKENVLAEWASSVPEEFTFAIKASQRITHFGRLKPESFDSLAFLLRNLKSLGHRLGPVLFQLPPNMKLDLPRLKQFLGELPDDQEFTIEFRNEGWFIDEVYDALRAKNVAMTIIEQEDFKSPVVATADWGYLRLHRFDYAEAAHTDWSTAIKAQGWKHAYVFFKHDEGEGSGPPAVDAFLKVCSA